MTAFSFSTGNELVFFDQFILDAILVVLQNVVGSHLDVSFNKGSQ